MPGDATRVALVTGGASGIGRATADRLGADGLRVFLVDRDAPGLDRAVGELTAGGVAAAGEAIDLASVAGCDGVW